MADWDSIAPSPELKKFQIKLVGALQEIYPAGVPEEVAARLFREAVGEQVSRNILNKAVQQGFLSQPSPKFYLVKQ